MKVKYPIVIEESKLDYVFMVPMASIFAYMINVITFNNIYLLVVLIILISGIFIYFSGKKGTFYDTYLLHVKYHYSKEQRIDYSQIYKIVFDKTFYLKAPNGTYIYIHYTMSNKKKIIGYTVTTEDVKEFYKIFSALDIEIVFDSFFLKQDVKDLLEDEDMS